MFQVEAGVKGAVRTTTRRFEHRPEAEAYAARVRSSNSIGSYWAVISQVPCTCPGDGTDTIFDALECPIHEAEALAECEAEQAAEIAAENAWLRHAENQMEDCPAWAM